MPWEFKSPHPHSFFLEPFSKLFSKESQEDKAIKLPHYCPTKVCGLTLWTNREDNGKLKVPFHGKKLVAMGVMPQLGLLRPESEEMA